MTAQPETTIRPPRREDYEPIVKAHMPCRVFEGEELMLRSSLLLMRDRAMATKQVASESGWALLDIVEREASVAALHRDIDIPSLREFRRLCLACVMAASGFDLIYQASLPSQKGEANAGG